MASPPAADCNTLHSATLQTRAIHASVQRDAPYGSVTTPLIQSTTFRQSAIGTDAGHTYSRASNPTVAALEQALASFEGLPHALAFSTGMSAITTLLLGTLQHGDHVVCGNVVYGGTYRLLDQILRPFGVSTTFVDAANPEAVRTALQPNTRHVIVETPANPTLDVCDVAALATVTRETDTLLVVDNTFLTAALQDVASLGADVVVYSTTKYIEGHNATVGGAVLCRDEALHNRLDFVRKSLGTIQSPHNAWLTIRGLKTLPLRMDRHAENALLVAEWLESRDEVASVSYPFLKSSPGYATAIRQQRAGGGMIAFELNAGYEGAVTFCRSLECALLAENLGAVESIVTHPASMTHADVDPAERRRTGITDGLIRVSIGLEDPADLIRDFDQAIQKARNVLQGSAHSEVAA